MDTYTVWQTFRTSLKQFIQNRVAIEQDAEDILQEVFVKIHTHLPKLREEEKLKSWVYQIARHVIIDFYRSRGKRKEESYDLEKEHQLLAETTQNEESINVIVSFWLKEMMQRLPETYRDALKHTEYENLTQKELADKLGISLPGAKSRVQRAREKLKQLLLDCCHLELDRLGNVMEYQVNKGNCSCKELSEKM